MLRMKNIFLYILLLISFQASTQATVITLADCLDKAMANRANIQSANTELVLANLQRLQTLAPEMHAEPLAHWQGQRCVSHDRIPLVGPLLAVPDATLWLCAGMGARGISLSVLCGELLAANLNHEPLPMAASLAKLMAASRFG